MDQHLPHHYRVAYVRVGILRFLAVQPETDPGSMMVALALAWIREADSMFVVVSHSKREKVFVGGAFDFR